MKHLILPLLILTSCGMSGKQSFEQSGTSRTEIVLRFEFVDQLRALCEDSYLMADFPDLPHYKQAVSNCVFAKLGSVGATVPAINTFQDQYCKDMPPGLNPEQQASLISTCALFTQ